MFVQNFNLEMIMDKIVDAYYSSIENKNPNHRVRSLTNFSGPRSNLA